MRRTSRGGLAVALDGKTPKKLGLAPRVRSEKTQTRRKRAGCALKNPLGARDRDVRSTSPHAAEFELYFRPRVSHTPSTRILSRRSG